MYIILRGPTSSEKWQMAKKLAGGITIIDTDKFFIMKKYDPLFVSQSIKYARGLVLFHLYNYGSVLLYSKLKYKGHLHQFLDLGREFGIDSQVMRFGTESNWYDHPGEIILQ